MPLSRISARPATALGAFTYRELLSERSRAERASKRGRAGAAAMLQKIEAELAARREAKFDRAAPTAEVHDGRA